MEFMERVAEAHGCMFGCRAYTTLPMIVYSYCLGIPTVAATFSSYTFCTYPVKIMIPATKINLACAYVVEFLSCCTSSILSV